MQSLPTPPQGYGPLYEAIRGLGVPVPGDRIRIVAEGSDLDGALAVVERTWASALTVRLVTGPDAGELAAVTLAEAHPLEASDAREVA